MLSHIVLQTETKLRVQVDFFSNNIKALELSQQLSAMKILSKEVVSLSDPYAMFHLDDDAILPPPKWAPANEWTVNDDSMLLLSAQLYGIGQWDNIAADERLGLKAKLQGAIRDGTKVGDKAFPQGALLLPVLFVCDTPDCTYMPVVCSHTSACLCCKSLSATGVSVACTSACTRGQAIDI